MGRGTNNDCDSYEAVQGDKLRMDFMATIAFYLERNRSGDHDKEYINSEFQLGRRSQNPWKQVPGW